MNSEHSRGALGFRAHSGWAVLVALAGPVASPTLAERCRIELVDPHAAHDKQPYHAAAEMSLREAEKLLSRCEQQAQDIALKNILAVMARLRSRGIEVCAAGILLGSGRSLPALPNILASHPLIHTAEGEFFRKTLMAACKSAELLVCPVREREISEQALANLRLTEAKLESDLAAMGRQIGPPWRQDEKLATVAAWLSLASAGVLASARRAA